MQKNEKLTDFNEVTPSQENHKEKPTKPIKNRKLPKEQFLFKYKFLRRKDSELENINGQQTQTSITCEIIDYQA